MNTIFGSNDEPVDYSSLPGNSVRRKLLPRERKSTEMRNIINEYKYGNKFGG